MTAAKPRTEVDPIIKTDLTADKPDPTIKQAQRDVERGLKDTSKSTEMDNTYKKLK